MITPIPPAITPVSPARAPASPARVVSTAPRRFATGENEAIVKAAVAALRDNCYRCHGKEGTNEGGFNFILDLEKLARTHVKPESPSESLLFERLTANDDTVMPPPGEKPRPSSADIAAIEAWIEEGAPALAMEDGRVFLAKEQIVKWVFDDLGRANPRTRRFLRYFTLAHLYNAGVSNDELQSYRNAFVKLINSLSWNNELLTPDAVDPAKVVWRIDIRRLNWSSKEWDEVEQAYDYALEAAAPDEVACCEATESKTPLVRVDWFVHTASQPPLYHALLSIPATDQELEALLRVNAEANIDQEQVIRAGFNRSGVSQNNRLIERHKSPYGSYWKSYDFGGNVGRQNLFEHPLGPGGDGEYFQHDGGELIFSLPNGLQGYMLVDRRGQRLDKGPIDIVSDPKRPDKSVTNGVSCMSCHYTGVIAKADEIRNVITANRDAFENADDILALYREPKELDAALNDDAKRFAAAMTRIGISVLSRSGEPISAMAAAFEREIDLKLAACEFGLPPAEFEKRLATSETLTRSLGTLRVGGGMKRDQFAAIFREAASGLGVTGDAQPRLSSSSPSVRPRARDDDRIPRGQANANLGAPMRFTPREVFGQAKSHIGDDTEFVGGSGGGAARLIDETSLLYGVECLFSEWMGQQCVKQIVPLFSRDQARKLPVGAVAREGYAVGAVKVYAGQFVNAMQLVFMRVRRDGKLNSADSYTSEVMGNRGRAKPRTLTGNGAPIIGIHIRHGLIVDALALVVNRDASADSDDSENPFKPTK